MKLLGMIMLDPDIQPARGTTALTMDNHFWEIDRTGLWRCEDVQQSFSHRAFAGFARVSVLVLA